MQVRIRGRKISCMEIVLKKKFKGHKVESLVSRYSVPVNETTKTQLEKLKIERNLDVNGMLRDFIDVLIKQAHPSAD